MKKFLRRYLQAKDQRERAAREQMNAQILHALTELVRTKGHDGLAAYIQIVKDIYDGMGWGPPSKEVIKEHVTLYRDAVTARQALDRGSS